MESNQVDTFVLNRKVNHPELIFNQNKREDLFFEQDASETWKLLENGNCYQCQKHRYTMIFYEQEKDAPNDDLIEIKDKKVIQEVRKTLNLTFKDTDDIAPFIVGSVIVYDGFQKKLKMMRADLFSLLSISQSKYETPDKKIGSVIKKGVV